MSNQKSCSVCHWQWQSIKEHPKVCPRCKSYKWDTRPTPLGIPTPLSGEEAIKAFVPPTLTKEEKLLAKIHSKAELDELMRKNEDFQDTQSASVDGIQPPLWTCYRFIDGKVVKFELPSAEYVKLPD